MQEAITQPAPAATGPDYVLIKSDNKLIRIAYDEILFIEALQNYVAVYTETGKNILPISPFIV